MHIEHITNTKGVQAQGLPRIIQKWNSVKSRTESFYIISVFWLHALHWIMGLYACCPSISVGRILLRTFPRKFSKQHTKPVLLFILPIFLFLLTLQWKLGDKTIFWGKWWIHSHILNLKGPPPANWYWAINCLVHV